MYMGLVSVLTYNMKTLERCVRTGQIVRQTVSQKSMESGFPTTVSSGVFVVWRIDCIFHFSMSCYASSFPERVLCNQIAS